MKSNVKGRVLSSANVLLFLDFVTLCAFKTTNFDFWPFNPVDFKLVGPFLENTRTTRVDDANKLEDTIRARLNNPIRIIKDNIML
jgi:hypothetical protein